MNSSFLARAALAAMTFLFPLLACGDDPLAAAARKIFDEKKDAVVWVSVVAKVSFSAEGAKDLPVNLPDREDKFEALGTIIDRSGLVVAALNQLDPSRNISGREFRVGGNTVKIEAAATLKEVKVTLADGLEIPAELVMRDSDLDLAFIRIKTSSKEAQGVTFTALDLKASGPAQLGEEVVTLSRMDETLYRAPTLIRAQVTTLTRKPREFVRVLGATQGCPAFLMDGRILGIAVSRSLRNKSTQTVIVPAGDVMEIADQARSAAPAPEKTPAAKTAQ